MTGVVELQLDRC